MIAPAVSLGSEGPLKLVDELILTHVHSEFCGIPRIVQLSPDGEFLLSTTRVPLNEAASRQPGTEDSRPRYGRQVVLRRWKTRKEKVIPIPLFPNSTGLLMVWMSMNPFSADGKLLVVPAGTDEDGDGIAGKEEKLEPAVYDIESGKLRRIDVRGDLVWATFDAAGKYLIFTVVGERAVRTYVAPVETLQPKALTTWGIPPAPRPGDTTCVFGEVITRSDGGSGMKIVLYDYLKDAKAADLPIHERNVSVSFLPQWTADGRYLYCTAEHRQLTTQVWDIHEGKLVTTLTDCLPVGPCGGPTTMVLNRSLRDRPLGGLLHDARTGSQQPLSESTTNHPICTAGKYLVYERMNDPWNHRRYRAEVRAGQPVVRIRNE
jgi:hypothetical protein